MKWKPIVRSFVGIALALLLLSLGSLTVSGGGGNEGKEGGRGWVHYGDIHVYWDPADCDSDGEDDGYQYWWGMDRNQNGVVGEGWVWVDYGRYGGMQQKWEGTGYVDFGCYTGFDYFTDKVIHLEEYWVPGVTVPGGENKFVVKDNDGDGIYTGGYSTVLFWDGVTQQGDPPGPYNIQNKFLYTYDATGADGLVVGGEYWQMQYFMIPDEE